MIVEFDDGDRYPAAALDLQGENAEGEFEICAAFQYCLGKCHAYARALEAGFSKHVPGIWWTSGAPRQPVGIRYTLDRIRSVYDGDAGYYVYEKQPSV